MYTHTYYVISAWDGSNSIRQPHAPENVEKVLLLTQGRGNILYAIGAMEATVRSTMHQGPGRRSLPYRSVPFNGTKVSKFLFIIMYV